MVSLPGMMRTPFCHGHEIAALPRHYSWIITIIHEIRQNTLADRIIGGGSCWTTRKPFNDDVEPPSVRHEDVTPQPTATLGLTRS